MAWAFVPPAGWRETTEGEWHGPCLVVGAGEDCAWIAPDKELAGCRKCGGLAGSLTGEDFTAHLTAHGVTVDGDLDLGRASEKPEVWQWHAPDGTERKQFRFPGDRQKKWAKSGPGVPDAKTLHYRPADLPDTGTVVLTEGASDADAGAARGLRCIGRPPYAPSEASVGFLRAFPASYYLIAPDWDDAGVGQAVAWYGALTDAGLDTAIVSPVRLAGGEAPKRGWDLRDWLASMPDASTETLQETLDGAVAASGAEMEGLTADAPQTAQKPAKSVLATTGTPAICIGPASQSERHESIDRVLHAIGVQHRYNIRSYRCEVNDGAGWIDRTDRIVQRWRETLIPERCTVTMRKGNEDIEVPLRYQKQALNDALTGHTRLHEVDPFVAWLESLPAWDGQSRLDTNLETCFPSLNRYGDLVRHASKSLLLAPVWRAYRPGEKHDEVVILQSDNQGTAKSSFFDLLFPPEHRLAWFTDCIDFGKPTKEIVEASAGRVIVEAAEVVGFGRSELNRLKSLVSSRDDGGIRLAHRHDAEPRPRRFIIVGTTNDPHPIPADPSGSRRWIVFHILEGTGHRPWVAQTLDRDRVQLWAEALYRYRQGEPAYLPDSLREVQSQVNEQHTARNEVLEDAIEQWIAGQPDTWVFKALAEYLSAAGKRPRSDRTLADTLHLMGFTSARQRWMRGEKPSIRWYRRPGSAA